MVWTNRVVSIRLSKSFDKHNKRRWVSVPAHKFLIETVSFDNQTIRSRLIFTYQFKEVLWWKQ